MKPRWIAERTYANNDREVLQAIIIYPEDTSTEQIRREHNGIKHDRRLLINYAR